MTTQLGATGGVSAAACMLAPGPQARASRPASVVLRNVMTGVHDQTTDQGLVAEATTGRTCVPGQQSCCTVPVLTKASVDFSSVALS